MDSGTTLYAAPASITRYMGIHVGKMNVFRGLVPDGAVGICSDHVIGKSYTVELQWLEHQG